MFGIAKKEQIFLFSFCTYFGAVFFGAHLIQARQQQTGEQPSTQDDMGQTLMDTQRGMPRQQLRSCLVPQYFGYVPHTWLVAWPLTVCPNPFQCSPLPLQ